jgi:GntR family transcriptional regulator/MocR family aminotransferase
VTKRPRSRAGGILPEVQLDESAELPLYEQLYRSIRERILSGDLAPGTRLASTRAFASGLGLSRFTLVTTFDRLVSEGYLQSRQGGGTFVASDPPDSALHAAQVEAAPEHSSRTRRGPQLSGRGHALANLVITGPRGRPEEPAAFRPRRPPLDAFPFNLWGRLVRERWRAFEHETLDYGDPAGYMPLRQSIARHLRVTRGIDCPAESVIITSGSQQALDIVFRSILDPGDAIWVEDPGSLDARGPLVASGATLIPVPVDEAGLSVSDGIRLGPQARVAFVSPSHQYPLGVTMSAERRRELLDWADDTGAWIVEDDYDSYFRYEGKPVRALQALDAERARRNGDSQRVLYVGTFSKTMYPSLRLGFCVVPPHLAATFANARAIADRNSPIAEQAALASFIEKGYYDRHLRRVRTVCAERYAALRQQIRRVIGDTLTLSEPSAGTHVIGWLPDSSDPGWARRISKESARQGLVVFTLSRYCMRQPERDALVLGYGGISPERIARGVVTLARIIERTR